MTQDDYNFIMARYEQYCHSFIRVATQIKYLEDTHDLDLTVVKDRMWALLDQIVQDKPAWVDQRGWQ